MSESATKSKCFLNTDNTMPQEKTTRPLTNSRGTKLSSKGCEEYLKPLSNHHTDGDPPMIW
ncbi:hypothetical protein FRX31_017613 [Thalictrum thalictroides]|uniref:Uncharacterized protein n=1 Tax=Thalictrum thalictroides TaxID=46969 RepID=A0A7J6W8B6_THATH|nr:hypothetical protein FRX31_017613 [Thalictrum thalictroides]